MFFRRNAEIESHARRDGVAHANARLLSQLGYAISIHKLLRQPGSPVTEKWAAAFELLFPEADPPRFPGDAALARLVELGFRKEDASYMVAQRSSAPENLVVQLLAVMSGIPENEIWGVTYNI